ncbi:hypothetical protein COK59_04705 [Bacillus thuringiensis]|uniref:hypothetical protein n=1 Tax=Bacillus thuringiensis TaxID=1428 RepID=UPI000BF33368|nr:hypothetical protein [Bacillus thuringiensis]MED3311232.1 hypothetical protein [Bacillus thuringiensis]PFT11037.1 hypothetical protein COK59_04705 [Bacillus thuringiensis]PFU54583.1 hypothetical protein COK85_24570 [Bacillus thuringiensis]
MNAYETYSLILSGAGVVIAGLAAYFYYGQLKKMALSAKIAEDQLTSMAQSVDEAVKANALSTLNTVLTLEENVRRGRERLASATNEVKKLSANPSKVEVDFAEKSLNEAIENYLSSLDRLCACIRRNYVPEGEYRKDYREGIKTTIRNYTSHFGPGNPYINIVKLNDKWSEE